MSLLEKFEVLQIGPGLAAAVCTRLLADLGAHVSCIDQDSSSPLAAWLNHASPRPVIVLQLQAIVIRLLP